MNLTSRQRLQCALRGEPTDRPPIDLGATHVTGIAASTLSRLRRALGLAEHPVKVHEPMQILGWVEDDLRQALGIDTIGVWLPTTSIGFRNDGWKPWRLPDGTPVLISKDFEYTIDEQGNTLAYPCGDRTCSPSACLPKDGYYFDAIVRQQPLDEDHLDANDWAEQFTLLRDEDLRFIADQAERYHRDTHYGVVGMFTPGGLGDVARVPGVGLRDPKGLRDPNLWYEFLITHTDYIRDIFAMHTEVALKNLALYHQAVGDRIEVVTMSGTDFGSQRGPLISPDLFRLLWKPFYRQLNDWVHTHTKWKIFYHSCGGIRPLIEDFIEMGVDILNPVQCSADGMEAAELKAQYGDRLVFWGGGVDTQKTLPFGTVDQVRQQVRDRLRTFAPGGRFVFNTIHNIQHGVPVENLLAMYEEARSYRPAMAVS